MKPTTPVVISDTDAVYLYGLDIIAEQLAGADRHYYVHDGLGSVRQVLDSAGQLETRYAYDPFGVPLAGDGVPNPWQFTGEAWDAEVELLYLRARYYQPEMGRFVTKDPWPGNVWRPATSNRYAYVENNPVNRIDPSGLQGPGPGEERHPFAPWVAGGSDWLVTPVETDPLVRHVYTVVWRRMELAAELRSGNLDPMTFICTAIQATLLHMGEYKPWCLSLDDADCNRLAVRASLTALAASVQRAATRIRPAIPFEQGDRTGPAEISRRAIPAIEHPVLFDLPPYVAPEEYFAADTPEGWDAERRDKSYHFYTHAFMAYELRLAGVSPHGAYVMTDWQGRAYEQYTGALHALFPDRHTQSYSANDVVANRWGSAFGIEAYADPQFLIEQCIDSKTGCWLHMLRFR